MKLKKWVQNLLATNIVVSMMVIGSIFDSNCSIKYTILPIISILVCGYILKEWGDFNE